MSVLGIRSFFSGTLMQRVPIVVLLLLSATLLGYGSYLTFRGDVYWGFHCLNSVKSVHFISTEIESKMYIKITRRMNI
jgi:hypothetical protein